MEREPYLPEMAAAKIKHAESIGSLYDIGPGDSDIVICYHTTDDRDGMKATEEEEKTYITIGFVTSFRKIGETDRDMAVCGCGAVYVQTRTD